MDYKRILTIQDISCVGQCSLTVALPILSACGQETCILPSAVLSTHTMGFSFPNIRDLTPDIPGFQQHWQKENITFDAIYTGYLGSTEQIAYVENILQTMTAPGGKTIVDPAMADHGKLYPAFDMEYVEAMKGLVSKADVVIPNLTEACFLTGCTYREDYDEAYIADVVEKLHQMGTKWVVLTGIGYQEGTTGVLVSGEGTTDYYAHHKIPTAQVISTPPLSLVAGSAAKPWDNPSASPQIIHTSASKTPSMMRAIGTVLNSKLPSLT